MEYGDVNWTEAVQDEDQQRSYYEFSYNISDFVDSEALLTARQKTFQQGFGYCSSCEIEFVKGLMRLAVCM